MGIYFLGFLAMGLSTWLYCEYLFTRKVSVGAEVLSFCIGYLALIGISLSGVSWLVIIPFFAINCFLLWNNYACSPKTAILHSGFLTFVLLLSEELVATDRNATLLFTVNSSSIITGKLCYLVLALLGARFFTPHKQDTREPSSMLLFCSAPLLSAGVALASLFLGQSLTPQAELVLTLCQLALLAVNVIFFVLYNHLQKAHAATLELELSIQKDNADAAQLELLQTQAENQRILIHDIKNHLRVLEKMAAQGQVGDIASYIAKLDTAISPATQVRLCGDPILNMLLQRFKGECDGKHLHFYWDIREGCTEFMDAPGITALYSNLLSNAMEGAEASSGRQLELRVTQTPEQGVLVSVVNDCDLPPKTDAFGRLTTQKPNPRAHGVGLKSIERIVKRYGGIQTMYYDPKVRKFHHVIQFPR